MVHILGKRDRVFADFAKTAKTELAAIKHLGRAERASVWKSEPTTDRDQPSRVSEQIAFRLLEGVALNPLTLVMSSPQLRLGFAAKIYEPPILFPYATTAV